MIWPRKMGSRMIDIKLSRQDRYLIERSALAEYGQSKDRGFTLENLFVRRPEAHPP